MMQNPQKKLNNNVDSKSHSFLVNIPLFDTLDKAELTIVEEYIRTFEIDKGEFLFKEGEQGDFVCFVLNGNLGIIKKTDKSTVEIATLSKGCSVGEMSIIDESRRSATVRARRKTSLASLSQKDFEEILEKHPKIGVKILKALLSFVSMNMRRTSKKLAGYMEDYMSLLFDYRG